MSESEPTPPMSSGSSSDEADTSTGRSALLRMNGIRLVFTVANFVLNVVRYIQEGPWS